MPAHDARVEADLIRQLGYLCGLHHVTLPAVTVLESLPEITVIIDADPGSPGHPSTPGPPRRPALDGVPMRQG